ncbi:MAG: hypothetical protein KDC90_11920 [Ignavibacteriae bacterium]|nr:hypothetical protein [Ignavibacteriota bacterium]
MKSSIKKISPNKIKGWVKLTPTLVDHGNTRPLKYKIVRPIKETSRAVFYLHGLIGNLDECQEYDALFSQELNFNFIRIEHPLLSIEDPLQAAALFAGFTPATFFDVINNTSKLIDQISKNEKFDSVGIIGVSYGGFSAIVNAIRGSFAKKVMLISSTPDIAFAMENIHELYPGLQKKIAKLVARNFRVEGRNIRQGKGLYKPSWDKINPWVEPKNKNVEIKCIGNNNDPVMPGSSLTNYKAFMSKNYNFKNIDNKLIDGPPEHGELKGINMMKEFKVFFKNL